MSSELPVSRELPEGLSADTIAVRGGLARSGFHETAEALGTAGSGQHSEGRLG